MLFSRYVSLTAQCQSAVAVMLCCLWVEKKEKKKFSLHYFICLHSVYMLGVFNFLNHPPHWCIQHGCLDLFTADTTWAATAVQPSGLYHRSRSFARKRGIRVSQGDIFFVTGSLAELHGCRSAFLWGIWGERGKFLPESCDRSQLLEMSCVPDTQADRCCSAHSSGGDSFQWFESFESIHKWIHSAAVSTGCF